MSQQDTYENCEFTRDWFTFHILDWESWLRGFKDKPNLKFLEIGVFEGRSTIWLCKNILTGQRSADTVIDSFADTEEYSTLGISLQGVLDRFRANLRAAGVEDRVEIIQDYSESALKGLKGQYDLIYIDGSHTAIGTLQDAVLSFPLLKGGGVMIFDDYEWDTNIDTPMHPKKGIDAFLNVYGHQIEVIGKGYQVAIRKKPESL